MAPGRVRLPALSLRRQAHQATQPACRMPCVGQRHPPNRPRGVTGHRRLRSDDVPALQARVRAFLRELQARYPELPQVLLSPLAKGSDQRVAQVALELGLRVIAPLPLPIYRSHFDPADLQLLERQSPQVEVMALPLEPCSTPEAVAVRGWPATARTRRPACLCPAIAMCCWPCGTGRSRDGWVVPRRSCVSTCAGRSFPPAWRHPGRGGPPPRRSEPARA